MLVPFPLKSGRFVYINADYIVYVFPSGDEYSDIYMSTGATISVEGDEHIAYARLASAALEADGYELDEEEDELGLEEDELDEEEIMKANDRQVGGEHYRKGSIQPWDFIRDHGLNYFIGNVLKYIVRDKGSRLQNLEKAMHYLEKEIEYERQLIEEDHEFEGSLSKPDMRCM